MIRPTLRRLLPALAGALLALGVGAAWAVGPPSGQPVLNQALEARALTKSDSTTFNQTRGVFIGDAAACNIAVLFANDSSAVTLTNVQSGQAYPFSIKKLMSTSTTCTAVIALY